MQRFLQLVVISNSKFYIYSMGFIGLWCMVTFVSFSSAVYATEVFFSLLVVFYKTYSYRSQQELKIVSIAHFFEIHKRLLLC